MAESKYAILQRDAVAPTREQLRRAFQSLRRLTDSDAVYLAKDAFGVIVDGLSPQEAQRLKRALIREGVQVEAVSQDQLYPLPRPKRIRQLEIGSQALVAYDPIGRPISIEWPHVVVVAAGSVHLTEFKRTVREYKTYRTNGRTSAPITMIEHLGKEQRNLRLALQLVLDIQPICLRVIAKDYRGPRPQGVRNRTEHVIALIQQMCGHAREAVLNRGAEALMKDGVTTFDYPTRHAFEEEIVWLLWRQGMY